MQADIKKEYQIKKRKMDFCQIIIIAAIVILTWGRITLIDEHLSSLMFGVFVFLVLCVGLASYANWRCPACKKSLGRNRNPKFCGNCGVELHD